MTGKIASKEDVAITARLQKLCFDSYVQISSKLKSGMNELDIADKLMKVLSEKGIDEYWYDIPIFVLIGPARFKDMGNSDYVVKSPSPQVLLKEGSIIYIDMHPMDTDSGRWGDWNTMAVFHPSEKDREQVDFLKLVRDMLHDGIRKISSQWKGSDVFDYYLHRFKENNITLLDARNNVGHSMHARVKEMSDRKYLDRNNQSLLAGGIYAIEPGGFRSRQNGNGIVVGRFEECVFIPEHGNAVLLGYKKLLPLVI